ncbi:MAG: TIGR01212 family radical SAM protein, partial [Bacteroidaceae bacterium]
ICEILQGFKRLMVEYGVESTDENVLKNVNRGHTFAQSRAAITETAMRSIHTCAHIILGLPGASRRQMLEEPATISSLPLDILKLHQLQIVTHTQMARQYAEDPSLFAHIFASPRDYAMLAMEYVERLRPDLVIERFTSQSPDQLLIAPRWGMKNHEFVDMLKSLMRERHTWQGRLYTEA